MDEFEARCTSASCAGRTNAAHGVVKKVKRSLIDCPDCGSVLWWVKKTAGLPRRHRVLRGDAKIKPKKTHLDFDIY